MVECETVMKALYSKLGMEYRDTDSEDEGVGQQSVIEIDDGEADRNDNTMATDGGKRLREMLFQWEQRGDGMSFDVILNPNTLCFIISSPFYRFLSCCFRFGSWRSPSYRQ